MFKNNEIFLWLTTSQNVKEILYFTNKLSRFPYSIMT